MSTRLDKLKKDRLGKLKKLRELGVNPYPSTSNRKQMIAKAREMMGKNVSVAGRLRSFRIHGKITFADLEDESGKIQLFLTEESLGRDKYKLASLLDTGDFLDAQGKVVKTKAGEISVKASNLKLLSKAILPIPDNWFGLKDIETRSRKRYLDLLVNPQAKKVAKLRAEIVGAHREFLLKKGYIEFETPVLQPIYGGGLARPFKTYHNALGIPLYLRISTELYLKRLIVGGFEKVFEIARVFRNEGVDKNHNPEFTMLETMEAYIDYKQNMKLVEEMTEYVVKEVIGKTTVKYQGQEIDFKAPWKRLSMAQAVKKETGVDFMKIKDESQAKAEAGKLGVKLESYQQTWGLILAAIFNEKVEDKLVQPTFIYDFPVETSPLAKRSDKDPRFAERFEHIVAGMECSNNYSELNDPIELKERFKDERKKQRLGDEEAHQTDTDFIEAVEYGMPPTSGIGPGIDRLVMILTNQKHLRDIILFPTMRPEK
jgi:lysyl-tRNA synthetase class 2